MKLSVRAEYNIVALPPRGTPSHAMRPVSEDRIRVHGRAAAGLVRPTEEEFSALAFPTTFTVRLPGSTKETTGEIDLSVRWELDEGAITRCLKLDSAAGKPFRIRLLNRCDQVSVPLHSAPATRD